MAKFSIKQHGYHSSYYKLKHNTGFYPSHLDPPNWNAEASLMKFGNDLKIPNNTLPGGMFVVPQGVPMEYNHFPDAYGIDILLNVEYAAYFEFHGKPYMQDQPVVPNTIKMDQREAEADTQDISMSPLEIETNHNIIMM